MSAADTKHLLVRARDEARDEARAEARAEAAQEAQLAHRWSATAAASAVERGACQLEASLSRVLSEVECRVIATDARVSAATASLSPLQGCAPAAPAPVCCSCCARPIST
jgi:hypothetical protein